ncbi:PQQ-dependent sugar dehydrogenase [Serratia marcescens]|uniref:PQQ-dependent sugar dehydrogenase n=1 Tax=Serratia marcescens TaxID=615 RepID=UPI00237FBFDF|nr:PQQ-dependent sugar dehydrogenase [Serratia marcescens]
MPRLTLLAGLLLCSGLLHAAPTVSQLQDGLEHPWSLAFLPAEQGLLITERPGRLRLWQQGNGLSPPIAGVPQVYAEGQGGLLEVLPAPDFAASRRVYLSFAEPGEGGKAGTAVGYGRLSDDGARLENFKVIFRQQPKLSVGNHFGGKLVRLTAEGAVPPYNPWVGQAGKRPEVWSYGHRNPQGLALNPWSGAIWEHEHGPRGGDELNIPLPGKNYGWPLATYGINYSGQPIPEAKGERVPGTEQPLHYWRVSPGLSGMAFYDGQRFPAWRHSLFIGALAQKALIRLTLEGDKVVAEERLLGDRGERIREVRSGPDGYLYLLTDERDGKLLKVGAS